ncbi:MAG TPA: cytochrome c biogenesis protein CcdA [Anaerolineales bacterium]|jgi:cytochrome c-type biogenesis protein|nr:cytochrome c biogenesis protein CcdA [Anaerolineales bacterium]HQX17958.1 cytochrome c biogenesis protein CcdA [Anaerolineales bacterium]
MEFTQISLGLAFLAGLASFLSPCVFSLVPAYVGYLGGRAAGGETTENNRFITFTHGLAFVLGFSAVFITLGVAATELSRLLFDLRFILSKVGGAVVIIFGLHMIGVFRIPFLEYDTRVQQLPNRKWGYLSSALMGVFFSAGWSPCVGPVLGSILTLVINGGSPSQGVPLLSAYSAGLGIPFLLAALGVGWVSLTLRKYGKVMRYVEVAMGILLITVGIMLFFGIFERIAAAGQFFWIDFGL